MGFGLFLLPLRVGVCFSFSFLLFHRGSFLAPLIPKVRPPTTPFFFSAHPPPTFHFPGFPTPRFPNPQQLAFVFFFFFTPSVFADPTTKLFASTPNWCPPYPPSPLLIVITSFFLVSFIAPGAVRAPFFFSSFYLQVTVAVLVTVRPGKNNSSCLLELFSNFFCLGLLVSLTHLAFQPGQTSFLVDTNPWFFL